MEIRSGEVSSGHKLWKALSETERAALLSNCGTGVGTTWTDTAPEQVMPDDEWTVAARRLLRLRFGTGGTCACGMARDERGDHTLSCQRNHVEDENTQQGARETGSVASQRSDNAD